MSSTAPISSPPPSPSSRNNNKQQASLLDNDASTLRPVYPKDQQQPQPSLLTLNLYAPEKDVGIKLKFTPASTVEEVLTQTIRRLFSDSPEVRRVPWRLCRRTGSPSSHNNKTKKNSGSWLHVTNPISDYILADEEELDVMKPEQAPILIKVVVMETQGTVTCRVDPETTVWELLQNVLFKVHGRAEHPLDEYGLFTVAGKLLNEEHLLSDYSLVNMSKLEFKRIPQLPEAASPSASTTPTLSVTVINLLELENRTEDGQQQQEQLLTKQMSFPLDISVSDVLSKVIKLFPVKDRHQVALYVPSKRVWLRLDSTLASYSLENDAVLEIRPKYREVTVALPVPTGGKVFETYKFAEEDPAAALYELILFNNPHISDNYTAYTLCTRGGNTLDPKKSIWSYGTNNSRFEVLGKLEPVVVYINGREHKMNVDFTSPVHSIVEMACYKFNLLPVLSVNAMGSGGDDARLQHFVLHSPAGPLVRKSSLRQQGVPTNTTLILKDLREMSGSTGEASQLTPPSTSSSLSPAVSSSSSPAVSSPSRPQANDNLNKGGSKVGPVLSPSSSSASLSSPQSSASALSSSAPSSTLERGEPKEVELITIGEEKVNIKWLPATLNIGTEDGSYSGDTLETNIWEEEDSAQTVILSQEKGNEEENDSSGITAATLNKLVSYLTAADTHDIRFMKAIMMTYPSFTNPERLLSKLIERYNVPEGYSAAHVKKVQFRVCNVLKHWITKYFDHFDQALLRSLLEFINQSLIKDGHQSSATTLNNLICKKFQDLQNKNPMDEHNQAMYSAKEKPPPPNVIRNIGKKRNKDKSKSKITRGSEISISQFPRNLWECDEEEVARQLTINEFILYSYVSSSRGFIFLFFSLSEQFNKCL
ncbi:Son of sevenless 1 [Balamuthia mandrillaris]